MGGARYGWEWEEGVRESVLFLFSNIHLFLLSSLTISHHSRSNSLSLSLSCLGWLTLSCWHRRAAGGSSLLASTAAPATLEVVAKDTLMVVGEHSAASITGSCEREGREGERGGKEGIEGE